MSNFLNFTCQRENSCLCEACTPTVSYRRPPKWYGSFKQVENKDMYNRYIGFLKASVRSAVAKCLLSARFPPNSKWNKNKNRMQIKYRSGGFICLSCTHENEAWIWRDLYHFTEFMNYNQPKRQQQYILFSQLAKVAQLHKPTPHGLKQLKAAVFSWANTEGQWWPMFKV